VRFLTFAFVLFPTLAWADEAVTVYRAMCTPVEYEFWECTQKGGSLRPTTTRSFKLSLDNQTVMEEREFKGPYKFEHCKIMDAQNWSCAYNDNSGEVGMGKGEFYDRVSDPAMKALDENCVHCKATGQVSATEYYWLMTKSAVHR
jgi:hypothetical protein